MKEKELNILKCFSCIFLVLGLVFSTIYDSKNSDIVNIINYVSKVLVYPILLFVLGGRINIKKYSTSILIKFSLFLFLIGLLFNGFSLFIPNLINNTIIYDNFFIVNIFIIMSLSYLFFYIVKSFNLSNNAIWGLGFLFCILNTFLMVYLDGYTTTNIFINFIKDLFFSYSNNSYFSFFGWIMFPITGYLYSEILGNRDDSFKVSTGFMSLIAYIVLVSLSFNFYDGNLLVFKNDIDFYRMDIFTCIVDVSLCLFLYSFAYFLSKLVKGKEFKIVKLIGSNVYIIYIISSLIINYIFIGYSRGLLSLSFIECISIYGILFIISVICSKIFMKRIENF